MFRSFLIEDSNQWTQFLDILGRINQDVYYLPQYYKLYENYGDGRSQCFIFQEGENIALYPFLLNGINDLGYDLPEEFFDIKGAYGYNGVVSNCNDFDFRKKFYHAFNNYCDEQNIIAEFTRFHPILGNKSFSEGFLDIYYNRNTIVLDITAEKDDLWKNSYSSTNRNMIRKALKNNVEILESSKIEDYKAFYSIYVETMRNVDADAYLYFNEDYILNFKKYLANNHKLILAKYKNEVIGGMILMLYKDYAHYHLSGRKAEYGRFALNNLFLDYAIDIAKENNCKTFHFGGGTTSEENDSLLKFKSNFSKEKAGFFIGRKVHNEQIYNEVVRQWKHRNPDSYENNNKLILGYREV